MPFGKSKSKPATKPFSKLTYADEEEAEEEPAPAAEEEAEENLAPAAEEEAEENLAPAAEEEAEEEPAPASESLQSLVYSLIQTDGNIWGVSVINSTGQIIFQTDNWDISADVGRVMRLDKGSETVELVGVRFEIIENVPEQIVGTNDGGKGHVIICPMRGKGKVVCYIKPEADPRDSIMNVMNYRKQIASYL